MIAAINTVGSTLGDNLITSHREDYMSSGLIPADAVENDQEHINSLTFYDYVWMQYFVKTLSLNSFWRRTS